MAYAPTRAAAARSTRPAAWAALPLLSLLAALLAPSPAHGCTVFELMSSGFAANAVHLMHAEAVFGGGVNGTFFVDASAFAYRCSNGGGWHDFFDVQPEVLVPWSAAREAAEGEPCVRHTFDSVDALLDSRFHIGWDSWDQAGAMRLWRLHDWVQLKVDARLALLEGAVPPTIGFHIRGGDKGEEDVLRKRKGTTPADYISAVGKNWPGLRGGTCVLVGDDAQRIAEAEELAKREIGCRVLRTSTYFQPEGHVQFNFNAQPLEARCSGTVDFLGDIELLAHTDYAVLSYNSGLCHLVDMLRLAVYGKERWSIADASYTRQDYWRRIRDFYSADRQARWLASEFTHLP